MSVTIALQASLTTNGETRAISASTALSSYDVTTGRQTVGNTYEVFASSAPSTVGTFIYNDGTVDASIRVTLGNFTTNEFVFYTLRPGTILSIPLMFMSDNGQPTRAFSIHARSASGTTDLDYCLIS